MVGNTQRLRKIHTDLIRDIMRQQGSVTHNVLAEQSGLSVATCKNIITDLLQSGEVFEVEPADSTGGRPSKQFSYNPDHFHALLIYLRKEGERQILFSQVVDALGRTAATEIVHGTALGLEELDKVIGQALVAYPSIRVLALGIPGIVHDGRIMTCDIASFPTIGIVDYLSDRYGIPAIAENDVNATALGQYVSLGEDPSESFAYIYYPEAGGAGSGIIINGQLIRGYADFAGELSYLPGLEGLNQAQVQEDMDAFAALASHMVLALNCVVNPARVMLTGIFFNPALKQRIVALTAASRQGSQVPEILFEEDIHDSFVAGLTYLAMQELSCKYRLIERT